MKRKSLVRIDFNKHSLESLLPQSKRYTVFDTKIPCLCMMVFPSGGKTFNLYRRVKNRPQRIKIGRFPDLDIENARKEAAKLNALIILGGTPHEDKKEARAELSFKELLDRYVKEYSIPYDKKNYEEDVKMLERHFLPEYGRYKCSEITRSIMRKLHLHIGTNQKALANRIVAVVSAVMNFGINNDYLKNPNPCKGIRLFRLKSRDRFLREEELMAFFNALRFEDTLYQDYFSLLLYIGVRKSNLLSMEWNDINFPQAYWRISENNSKNDDVNIIHLPHIAIKILKRRQSENDSLEAPSKYVFPGFKENSYISDPKKSFRRIKKRMKVDDIRMHDLRRTLASYMAINGSSLAVIGKALNHKSLDSTAIYARLSQEPVKNAVNAAVDMITGNNVFSLAVKNKEMLLNTLEATRTTKFADLLAA